MQNLRIAYCRPLSPRSVDNMRIDAAAKDVVHRPRLARGRLIGAFLSQLKAQRECFLRGGNF
jgi:hypothetical protein